MRNSNSSFDNNPAVFTGIPNISSAYIISCSYASANTKLKICNLTVYLLKEHKVCAQTVIPVSAVRTSGAPVPAESKPVFISFCMALYAAALLKLISVIKTHKGAKGYKAAAVFSKRNIIPPIYCSRRGALQAQKTLRPGRLRARTAIKRKQPAVKCRYFIIRVPGRKKRRPASNLEPGTNSNPFCVACSDGMSAAESIIILTLIVFLL